MVFILFSLQCLISVNDFDCLYKLKDYFTFDYIAVSGLKLQNLYIHPFCRNNIFVSNSIFFNIHDWSLTGFSKNGLWPLIWFYQGSHKKHNPKLLKESVDKSLEMLQQGKLRGPHISGQFELDQVSWN